MSILKKNKLISALKKGLITCAFFSAATVIGYGFSLMGFSDTNVVIVYLLAVLATVWLTNSLTFGLIASLFSVILFNYLFTEPFFAFSVYDPNYVITFINMALTAVATSALTSHARRSERRAQQKQTETDAIYNLTNHLTDAASMHDIASISIRAISACFDCQAGCLCFDSSSMPECSFIQQSDPDTQVHRAIDDISAFKMHVEGLRTAYAEGDEFCDWPIYGSEGILGVMRIPTDVCLSMDEPQSGLLRSMIESTALAMDRLRSSQQRMKTREEVVKERYRANLLRAISHDLRTPLSGIIGSCEMIVGMSQPDDPRHGLASDVLKEADWLHSLVENILNLTRLSDGSLAIKKQMEAIEEVVGGAISHMEKRSPEHEISVSMPDNLILVPMDARLIEQVLINLLDNAARHTAPGNEIEVNISPFGPLLRVAVRDRGTGIPQRDLPHVFEMFFTSRGNLPDSGHGMGLGLAICETIVKAHGGTIEAHNRQGGGAEFIFTLPMEDTENPEDSDNNDAGL